MATASSIGRGGQRTTQDVRNYDWKGLDRLPMYLASPRSRAVTTKRKAHSRLLQQSDLVLFLVTDDAPQDAEAECLARVRSLGKPILGICNVKIALNNADDSVPFLAKELVRSQTKEISMPLSDSSTSLRKNTIQAAESALFTLISNRSSYLNNPSTNRSGANWKHASRFNYIEKQIISEVVGRGNISCDGRASLMVPSFQCLRLAKNCWTLVLRTRPVAEFS